MFVSKLTTLSIAVILAATTTLSAQNLRNADEPAEFPPSSFAGNQYVDSKGCVYIRAGISGNTTWVPRVNRQRNVICGFQPSIANAKPAATAPAPRVAAAPKPAPRQAAPAPKPAPRVAKTQPRPKASQPLRTTAAIKAAPKRVVKQPTRVVRQQAAVAAAPKPAPKRVVRQVRQAAPEATANASCQGASGISARYINQSSSNLPVRCGPQAEAPVTLVGRAGTRNVNSAVAPRQQQAATAPRTQRILRQAQPRPTGTVRYTNNSPESRVVIAPPQGYKPVWEDDRLNPLRGAETLAGRAATNLVWTQEVPRRLLDRRTGKDVTMANPNLVYPYTDLTTQIRQTARSGAVEAPAKRVRAAKAAAPKARVSTKTVAPRAVAKAPVKQRRAVAPVAPKAQSGASHRFVQVGTFGVPSNAQAAARRLQAAGLPARIGKYSKGGKSYQIVLAGPFQAQANLNNALKAARRAGFGDAFFRK